MRTWKSADLVVGTSAQRTGLNGRLHLQDGRVIGESSHGIYRSHSEGGWIHMGRLAAVMKSLVHPAPYWRCHSRRFGRVRTGLSKLWGWPFNSMVAAPLRAGCRTTLNTPIWSSVPFRLRLICRSLRIHRIRPNLKIWQGPKPLPLLLVVCVLELWSICAKAWCF